MIAAPEDLIKRNLRSRLGGPLPPGQVHGMPPPPEGGMPPPMGDPVPPGGMPPATMRGALPNPTPPPPPPPPPPDAPPGYQGGGSTTVTGGAPPPPSDGHGVPPVPPVGGPPVGGPPVPPGPLGGPPVPLTGTTGLDPSRTSGLLASTSQNNPLVTDNGDGQDPPPPPPPPPPPETDQQKYDRFFRDYWAPDRDAVLASMKAKPPTGTAGSLDWVKAQLAGFKSTDDPTYWVSAMAKDPKVAAGDPSAIAYWVNRMRIGDGAEGVRNGTVQKFQDGGGGGGDGAHGSDFQSSIRAMLMKILQGASGPVDPNSPDIAQPYEAAKLSADRSLAGERSSLAERLYAEGGGGTNELAQGIQQSSERNAVGLAGIKSQLIGRAFAAKQAQLQQALALAVQSGDLEAARQIQLQMWNDRYGLDREDAQYQRDRDAARAKSGLPF